MAEDIYIGIIIIIIIILKYRLIEVNNYYNYNY